MTKKAFDSMLFIYFVLFLMFRYCEKQSSEKAAVWPARAARALVDEYNGK